MKFIKYIIFFLPFNSDAQFYKSEVFYLLNEKLDVEFQGLIKENKNIDSFFYLKTLYDHKFGKESEFELDLKHVSSYLKNDSDACALISFEQLIRYQKLNFSWQNYLYDAIQNEKIKSLQSLILMTKDNRLSSNANIPDPIYSSYKTMVKMNSKSSLAIAGLSAIVPGLGKLYMGQPKRFLSTFLLNSMYSIQTYESIKKLGLKHPVSIVNILFSVFFYAANVYGSYNDAIYFKSENKRQFIIDGSTYYLYDYYPSYHY